MQAISFFSLFLLVFRFFSASHWRRCEIIVGVDGGATSAVAILDYDGRIVALESKKNWSASEIIGEVMSVAADSPLLVASDVNPASKLARQVKAAFNAKLFKPTHSLGQLEKTRLVEKHLRVTASRLEPANAHERDALAAAVKAFHSIQNKMRQVRAKAAGFQEQRVKSFQAEVLRGKKMASTIKK
ncbi:MAG: DUF460 domain-containing protein [Candidatus Micrarchaeia archaeon]